LINHLIAKNLFIFRSFLILALLLFVPSVLSLNEFSHRVLCESIDMKGLHDTCVLHYTSINIPETTILSNRDNAIGGLSLRINSKVKFLPANIYETFPSLVFISAHHCAIRWVSKNNFRNLRKLTSLDLSYNSIRKIPSDAFEDLISLEKLTLSKKHK
jgi:Leucine-rich repeat (LRR) protein